MTASFVDSMIRYVYRVVGELKVHNTIHNKQTMKKYLEMSHCWDRETLQYNWEELSEQCLPNEFKMPFQAVKKMALVSP